MAAPTGPHRRFLMMGHTQSTDPGLPLNDLPGAGGRLDVLVRAVTAALCLSHGLRGDTEIWTVIDHEGVQDGPRTLVFRGDRLRNLNPDERSTAALFKKAFAADTIGHLEEVHPGIEAAAWGLRTSLARFSDAGPLVVLDKDAPDLREASGLLDAPARPGFVLSDHRPWSVADEALLEGVAARVSVGPRWLHGHQAITLVHDALDRRP